ncbi:cysteine desulfurase [Candidatus Falkowbacteria bacterium]|nr:cysteine desulfurase [Candidatus Falkowbacteria bacterium]
MKPIYFDNSATTPLDRRVLAGMTPYLTKEFGNSGSIHSVGQRALAAVDGARDKTADFLNCDPQEIIFTAGATESNNLAIQGVVNYFQKRGTKIHLITSKIEHPSVLEVMKEMEKRGVAVSYANVDNSGVVKTTEIARLIRPETVLISVMYANNEVGSIQPIEEIASLIKTEKARRKTKDLALYFHVDAVQAVNYLNCDVQKLGTDFLTMSGHKIYGPKGIGALFVRRGVKIEPLYFGGHQEYALRPGTLNVAGIVGLGKAVELVEKERSVAVLKLKKIKRAIMGALSKIPEARFNGDAERQLPNIINVSFRRAEGESILMMLDMAGIAVSTGSACSSGSLEPSHVLSAMRIKPEWSHGSVRISLGRCNSEAEVDYFIKKLKAVILKLRSMAP